MYGEFSSSKDGANGRHLMRPVTNIALGSLTSTQKGFILFILSIPPDIKGTNIHNYVSEKIPHSAFFERNMRYYHSLGIIQEFIRLQERRVS